MGFFQSKSKGFVISGSFNSSLLDGSIPYVYHKNGNMFFADCETAKKAESLLQAKDGTLCTVSTR